MTASCAMFKPSVFTATFDRDGKRLIFNASTSRMLELDAATGKALDDVLAEVEARGTCSNGVLLQHLIDLGFVVSREEAEYDREHAAFLAVKASRDTLRITIAPTLACNLRCTYCFQQNLQRGRAMTPEVRDGVIELVRRKLEESRSALVVQWFGGEPLLAYDHIRFMSEAFQRDCERLGIPYYAEMLTNGTRLTPQIIASFESIALKAIQIPLDGRVSEYSERKNLPFDRASSFHRFLIEHMQTLVDATGSVTIRINCDRQNPEAGQDVVRMFKEHGCVDPRIDFRLGFLNTSRGLVDCIPHDCFTTAEFSSVENTFRRFLAEEGYHVFGSPGRRDHTCIAPLDHAFTIDPQGRIGKCVPSIGTDESVFSCIYPHDIERTVRELSTPGRYAGFDPFLAEPCRGCALLPACLGSCPKMHEPNASLTSCMKEGLAERLDFYCRYQAGKPIVR
jgi:uncharacterized protein